MTHWLLLAISLVLPLQVGAAGYSPDARRDLIVETVDALVRSSPERIARIENAVYVASRSRCRAAFGTPTVGCVIDAARDSCRGESESERAGCVSIADVAATNLLGETQLVGNRARFSLMNAGGDFREAMRGELRRRYALLAAEYAISSEFDPDAPRAGLDAFCVEVGQTRDLPWQRCVAALAWYMGTER